jgi:hypothetical protein
MASPKRPARTPKASTATPKRAPPSVEGSEVVGVRIPRDLLAAVDARVDALNTSGDVPSKVTRAGLLLHVIRGAVTEWERSK